MYTWDDLGAFLESHCSFITAKLSVMICKMVSQHYRFGYYMH